MAVVNAFLSLFFPFFFPPALYSYVGAREKRLVKREKEREREREREKQAKDGVSGSCEKNVKELCGRWKRVVGER